MIFEARLDPKIPDPEQLARQEIDALLGPCGWLVQDKNAVNLAASRGVAVRELSFMTGEQDYTLFVDGKAIGTIEAKPAGHSLTGVEEQSEKYVKGVPFGIPAWRSPLPFSYESTGTETRFTNRFDPVPRSRNIEELEGIVNANLQRANRLRQSILRSAFKGEAVQLELHGHRIIESG